MKNKIFGFSALIVFVASAVIAVLDAVVWESKAFHPILLFVGALVLGEGLVFAVNGFVYKHGFSLTIGGFLSALGALYFCLDFIEPINVTVAVIVPLAVLVVFVALAFLFGFRGVKMTFDNDSPDYKTYRQRKEEEKGE